MSGTDSVDENSRWGVVLIICFLCLMREEAVAAVVWRNEGGAVTRGVVVGLGLEVCG